MLRGGILTYRQLVRIAQGHYQTVIIAMKKDDGESFDPDMCQRMVSSEIALIYTNQTAADIMNGLTF